MEFREILEPYVKSGRSRKFWNSIDFYGILWDSMVIYGILESVESRNSIYYSNFAESYNLKQINALNN